jgi:hypothetical protein
MQTTQPKQQTEAKPEEEAVIIPDNIFFDSSKLIF